MDALNRSQSPEIALVGDLTDNEVDITSKLLDVPRGGSCVLYIDSPGGSPYSGMALMAIIKLRGLQATGIVTGECSSSALWPFAACSERLVTPFSVLLFHPLKWQSEEHVGLAEAAEWARHFGNLETEMDQLLAEMFDVPLAQLSSWLTPGRYVSGRELADAGMAEVIDLSSAAVGENGDRPRRRRRTRVHS